MNYESLSKTVSHALRHDPSLYGLILDVEGWVKLEDLINGVRLKLGDDSIQINDIVKMIELSPKKRHEILGDKIRASYGHSITDKLIKVSSKPPRVLYHGTTKKSLEPILKNGIQPMKRQYVHLSERIDEAELVASRRKDKNILLLRIESYLAFENGIKFYQEKGGIWLADFIPSQYIKI